MLLQFAKKSASQRLLERVGKIFAVSSPILNSDCTCVLHFCASTKKQRQIYEFYQISHRYQVIEVIFPRDVFVDFLTESNGD